jgi:site-specific recombinase
LDFVRDESASTDEGESRIDALLSLAESETYRLRFGKAIAAMFSESDGTLAFGHAGIPTERGFFAELGERVMNHLLPRPRNDRDLGNVLRRLFRNDRDIERLSLAGKRFAQFADLAFPPDVPESSAGLRHSFANGFRLLATWTQAQGLSPKIRKRSRPIEVTESPFYRVARVSEALVDKWLSGVPVSNDETVWRRESERCREEMVEIHRRLDREGVSTHVVYGLEVIERCLARMSVMVDIMVARNRADSIAAAQRLLASLAISVRNDYSVRHLVRQNTHLLLRRIVERTGSTGEHYVTATRSQYRQMWLAAAGGGLLTVGTAAIKTTITATHTPDFVHGFLYGLNYAISFLLLQHLHLVLATKQPAMTAAALATIVRERHGEERSREAADYFARIVRSQLAAAMGNVIVVALGCATFDFLWELFVGHPFLARKDAEAIYQQLSPVNSGTVFYAALTGVILWLGSVCGGWFDNLCAYHHVARAIAQHPAGRYLGRDRLERWGDSLAANASGWGTNVSLGFMLGMTPAIGLFFGLPLDVRHVTLNAGILSLATASLGRNWFGGGMFLYGVAGIAVMFVLNLSVSFGLALYNAARAYNLPRSGIRAIARRMVSLFTEAPRDFFIPPPDAPTSIFK